MPVLQQPPISSRRPLPSQVRLSLHISRSIKSLIRVAEEPIVLRDFTREELSKFNGENGAKIYLAIKGKVFDVTRSAHFYGPKGCVLAAY